MDQISALVCIDFILVQSHSKPQGQQLVQHILAKVEKVWYLFLEILFSSFALEFVLIIKIFSLHLNWSNLKKTGIDNFSIVTKNIELVRFVVSVNFYSNILTKFMLICNLCKIYFMTKSVLLK